MKVKRNNQEQLFDPEEFFKEASGVLNQHQQITFGTLGDGKGYVAEVTKRQEKHRGRTIRIICDSYPGLNPDKYI